MCSLGFRDMKGSGLRDAQGSGFGGHGASLSAPLRIP